MHLLRIVFINSSSVCFSNVLFKSGGIEVTNNFTVLIEQGEDGAYVATVPALKSCYTQASSISELLEKTKEVIELCLEEGEYPIITKFIGIQQMEIAI